MNGGGGGVDSETASRLPSIQLGGGKVTLDLNACPRASHDGRDVGLLSILNWILTKVCINFPSFSFFSIIFPFFTPFHSGEMIKSTRME